MINLLFNLQLFGEGGGASAGAGTGASDGTGTVGTEGEGRNSLENVIYGKADPESLANSNQVEADATNDDSPSFDELIKGKYKDEYQKRVQKNINERFKDYGQLQNSLKAQQELIDIFAEKYGVDATDTKALRKAIDEDKSFYEEEAMKEGLSVEQYKEMRDLKRQNAQFRAMQEEQEAKQNGQRIYSEWLEQGEALKSKYGIENFNLQEEVSNPQFLQLLKSGIDVEGAYKAIHFDDMVGGAMVRTASEVKKGISNNIASRQARPSENGVSSQNTSQFKQDVHALTKADRAEIARRASRGVNISF